MNTRPQTSARAVVFSVLPKLALLFLWPLAHAAALAATPTTNTLEVTVRNDRSTNISFSLATRCLPMTVSGGIGYTVEVNPAHGSLTRFIGPLFDQIFQYTPTASFVGDDTFVIKRAESCSTSPNPPEPLPDEYTIVLAHVVDPPPPPTNFVEVIVRNDRSTNLFFPFDNHCSPPLVGGGVGHLVVDEPEHGSVTGSFGTGGQVFQYVPVAGYVGDDTFVIRRTQPCASPPEPPELFEEFTVVRVQVVDPNRPFAIGQSLSVNEDTPLPVTLTGIAQGADPLTFAILTSPGHGTLSGTPPDVIYTPAPNYHGLDSFTFEASDSRTNSAPATISITVLAVNDPPEAVASLFPSFQLFPNLTVQLVLAAKGTDAVVVFDGSGSSDADGDALTFAWFETGQPAPFAIEPTTTNLVEVGEHSITLVVNDGVATGTAVLPFQVITPGEALDIIIEQLNNSNLARNKKRPLLASLKAAGASLDRGQFTNAASQLLAFENKVRAQISRDDPALAGELIQAVEMLRQAIQGG